MQCLLRMNVYPFRSERSFDPALLATANTVPCVLFECFYEKVVKSQG